MALSSCGEQDSHPKIDWDKFDFGEDYEPLGRAIFQRTLKYGGLEKQVSFEMPIPMPEYSDINEFFAHIVATQNVLEPFRKELLSELKDFYYHEKIHLEDDISARVIEDYLTSVKNGTAAVDYPFDISEAFEEELKEPLRSAECRFGDNFIYVMGNSSSDHLTFIMNTEIEMADEMRALIRARDWELDSLTKECENVMVVTAEQQDAHPHQLSKLNEKMRQVHGSYACQIDALVERQRNDYHKIVESICEKDEIPAYILERKADDQLFMSRSSSIANQLSGDHEENQLDESFTIYLGAQLKTMHNVRLLSRSKPLLRPMGGDVSARLHAAMTLYGRDLSAMILLAEKDPMWHVQERTDFARACEQSTELHFKPLVKQLEEVSKLTREASRISEEFAVKTRSRTGDESSVVEQVEKMHLSDGTLPIGNFYNTEHSNLEGVQVVCHLVVDPTLKTEDMNSRHPCLNGIHDIILMCAEHGITTINIPLFLVDEANESMTVAWCVRRAELIFKCVKGYLMEVCGSGWSSSAPGGPALAHAPHYNINFVLPAGLAPSVHTQISSMLPTIYHLVPSKTA